MHIGGTDFDKQLSLAAAMPHLGYRSRLKGGAEMPSRPYFNLATWHTINSAYTRQSLTEQRRLANDAACRLFPDQGPLIGQGGDEALPEALAPLLDGRSRDTDVVCAGRAYHVEAHPLGGHEGERGLLLSFTCEGCQR